MRMGSERRHVDVGGHGLPCRFAIFEELELGEVSESGIAARSDRGQGGITAAREACVPARNGILVVVGVAAVTERGNHLGVDERRDEVVSARAMAGSSSSAETPAATRTGGSSSSSVAAIEEREQTDGGGAVAIRIAPEFRSQITSFRRWPVREPWRRWSRGHRPTCARKSARDPRAWGGR